MVAQLALAVAMAGQTQIHVVDKPPAGGANAYYVGCRPPLRPSPFRKLPIGAIRPEGWVRKQLQLEADGFVGHLTEISEYLKKENNAWLSPTGEGVHGWEEVPYWLKGFGDLGYVLGDKRVTDEALFWIEHVLKNQAEDGWLGPRSNLKANDGKPDMWPNMVMLNALQSYYERFGDPRVLTVMERYFRFQLNLSEDDFYLSYWEKHRGGDNLASVLWLYNRIGEPWLLDLARKIHRRTADWTNGIPDWHGVNFAQAFREPATFGMLEQDPKYIFGTERDYETMRRLYGQTPGGMYGADENARPGFSDPRQATETCAMVEMMLSSEMLLRETGDSIWASRCEDVAFNSLPASMTPNLKALHYLTAPNMAIADKGSKSPGLQNGGPMLLFDPHDHRCCQHNVSHGWPYFAEHLWFGTDGNGLGAAIYSPCTVTAKAGSGQEVTIREETQYPFGESIRFRFSTKVGNRFPLTLRIPFWCSQPEVLLDGTPQNLATKGNYAIIDREWREGDVVELRLPMEVSVRHWDKNKGSISIDRGPLTYSLKIGEAYQREGGTDAWPAFEIHPTTPWNYGLEEVKFEVIKKPFPKDGQPFVADSAPIEIRARARKIPEWTFDRFGLVGTLQGCPAHSDEPLEEVTMIPMGAARLRIASFPTVSTNRNVRPWAKQPKQKKALPASASHVWISDTLEALSDGMNPVSSSDETIPRFTWWDHKGGIEWVEYDLPTRRRFSRADVYWFDDGRTGGGCRVPAGWRLLYRMGNDWREVHAHDSYGLAMDRFNTLQFEPVTASTFRIEVHLQNGYSGGILEWVLR